MSDIDYNTNRYNIEELVEILGLKLPANKEQIIESINLNKSKTNNEELIKFFNNIQEELVGYLASNNTDIIEPNSGYGLYNIYDLKKGYENSTVGDRINNNVNVVVTQCDTLEKINHLQKLVKKQKEKILKKLVDNIHDTF